jgi:hypothetical protein
VVSLGTGGALFKKYKDTVKARIIIQAVIECRTTAENLHKHYSNTMNVKYYRFDPDVIGRYAMDDATALNSIQSEVANWCVAARHDELRTLAFSLADAVTETTQVCADATT